jgi:hypothetical protein
MKGKYSYIDPDLDALYDAEAAARGEARPSPRKKRHTTDKDKQQSVPSSPYLLPSTSRDFAIDPSLPLQQPEPQPYGYPQPAMSSNVHYGAETRLQPLHQALPPVDQIQVRPHLPERFTFDVGSITKNNKKFLITLCDDLIAKGHSIRLVSNISEMWNRRLET